MNKLLLTSACAIAGNMAVGAEKPNILWITSEDNNVTYIGCYGNEVAKTPHIDQMARDGFRYTNCFSNGAVCSASRSSWITGMIAPSVGSHNHRSRVNVPARLKLYPKVLQETGYYTSNVVKTDYNIPFDRKIWNSTKLDWKKLKTNQPFFQVYNIVDSHESRAMGTTHTHPSDKVKIAPYHPDTSGVRDNYAHYYDAITNMDAKVGKAIAGLKASGMADNTIIIYNSDHGGALPRGKRYMYNSGTHCPLVIVIPDKLKHLWPSDKPGSTVDRLVSFVDMPATWISLAGGTIPSNYQGRVFLGKDKVKEAKFHYSFRGRNDERIENTRAVRDKQFLYVKNYIPYVPRGQHLDYQWKIPMQRFWEEEFKNGRTNANQSRFFQVKDKHELYDTAKDPFCLKNEVDNPEFKEIVAALSSEIKNRQQKIYDAGLIPESEINKRAADNGITVYEAIRKKELYNLEAYQHAADIALDGNVDNISQLKTFLKDSDSGVRYWGAVGCLILKEKAAPAQAELTTALTDKSHNVRVIAAWVIGLLGDTEVMTKTYNQIFAESSYACLEAANAVAWMGDLGKPIHPSMINCQHKNKLVQQMKNVFKAGSYNKSKPAKGKEKCKNKKK